MVNSDKLGRERAHLGDYRLNHVGWLFTALGEVEPEGGRDF